MTVVVDIEPTNRCYAKCYFCPRDRHDEIAALTGEAAPAPRANTSKTRRTIPVTAT